MYSPSDNCLPHMSSSKKGSNKSNSSKRTKTPKSVRKHIKHARMANPPLSKVEIKHIRHGSSSRGGAKPHREMVPKMNELINVYTGTGSITVPLLNSRVDITSSTMFPQLYNTAKGWDKWNLEEAWFELTCQCSAFATGANYIMWEPDIADNSSDVTEVELLRTDFHVESKHPQDTIRLKIPNSKTLWCNDGGSTEIGSLRQTTHGRVRILSTVSEGSPAVYPKMVFRIHGKLMFSDRQTIAVSISGGLDEVTFRSTRSIATETTIQSGKDNFPSVTDIRGNVYGGSDLSPILAGPWSYGVNTASADAAVVTRARNSLNGLTGTDKPGTMRVISDISSSILANPVARTAIKALSFAASPTGAAAGLLGWMLIETGTRSSVVDIDYERVGTTLDYGSRVIPVGVESETATLRASLVSMSALQTTGLPTGYAVPSSIVVRGGSSSTPTMNYYGAVGSMVTSPLASNDLSLSFLLEPNSKYAVLPYYNNVQPTYQAKDVSDAAPLLGGWVNSFDDITSSSNNLSFTLKVGSSSINRHLDLHHELCNLGPRPQFLSDVSRYCASPISRVQVGSAEDDRPGGTGSWWPSNDPGVFHPTSLVPSFPINSAIISRPLSPVARLNLRIHSDCEEKDPLVLRMREFFSDPKVSSGLNRLLHLDEPDDPSGKKRLINDAIYVAEHPVISDPSEDLEWDNLGMRVTSLETGIGRILRLLEERR
jgi:hypothetical protein